MLDTHAVTNAPHHFQCFDIRMVTEQGTCSPACQFRPASLIVAHNNEMSVGKEILQLEMAFPWGNSYELVLVIHQQAQCLDDDCNEHPYYQFMYPSSAAPPTHSEFKI